MNQSKVSVLLPVYNTKAEYLQQCLDSIYNQTFKDFELILVNNCSTDESTINVINGTKKDNRVKIIDVPRQSGKKNLSVALNNGLLACSHELVARMDSDDIMFSNRLEKQLHYFNKNWSSVDILGTQLETSSGGKTCHKEIIDKNEYKKSTHFCSHPTIMFKKSVIVDLGGYRDTPNYIPEDFCLWTKALKRGYKIRNMQEILLWYREEAIGLSLIDSQRPEWYQAIAESRNSVFDFKRYI